MTMTSIGDLAQGLMLRSRTVQLRQTMDRLTGELATGQVRDVTARLGGDFTYLSEIDRSLAQLGGYRLATSEAALFADAAQAGLARIQDVVSDLGPVLISASVSGLAISRENAVTQAGAALEATLGALNGEVSGRSLFAGTATDRAPLASADTLLTALRSELAGLTTAGDIIAATDAWFADPAGFTAVMYDGAATALAPFRLGAGEQVSMTLKADDPALTGLARDLALAALATEPALGLTEAVQDSLLGAAGESLMAGDGQLTALRADLGFAQARIEAAEARNAAAQASLEHARGELLQADPFETATRLEEVQFRLESLYSVTVRTSRLSLLSFLE